MKIENALQYDSFLPLDRTEMVSVAGGGSVQRAIDLIRKIVELVKLLGEMSECVDDFIEGYQEGLAEARNN